TDVSEADNLVADPLHQHGSHGAHIAEALNDHAAAFAFDAELGQRLVAADHDASASGFASARGAAELDGLSGDNRGGGLSGMHRECVHDPGHGLLVGAHVGSGDVALWSEPAGKFGRIAARETLEFAAGHFARVADDAALGAAEGNVDDGALPSHPSSQSAYFIQAHVGGETNSAFAGSPDRGMENAIASEDLQRAVVHSHRDVHRNFLVGILQIAINALLEPQFLRSHLETRFGVLVDIH